MIIKYMIIDLEKKTKEKEKCFLFFNFFAKFKY
jgi:hypothetical protein